MQVPEQIKTIQLKNKSKLLAKKNVNGIGYGFKYTAGKQLEEPTLIVFVEKKEPLAQLLKKDLVPAQIDSVNVDVRAVGKIVAYKSRTSRWRPAPGGVSIGHYLITAGTLGAIVKDKSTGKKLILSNNHVMANSNDASKGDSIIQPGKADGGNDPQDMIATLERFVRIDMEGGDSGGGGGVSCPIAKGAAGFLNVFAAILGSSHRVQPIKKMAGANVVDAAVAKPIDGDAIDDEILEIGKIDGTIEAELGKSVRKSGRTTGFTTGRIEAIDAVSQVGYGGSKVATYEHQILTSNMSSPGDSGSLLVDGVENKAVGLLFAGSDEVTVHCPISYVLDLLDITF